MYEIVQYPERAKAIQHLPEYTCRCRNDGTRTQGFPLCAWEYSQQALAEIEDREMATRKSKGRNSRAGAKKAPRKARGEKHIQLAEDTGLAQPEVLNSEATSPPLPNSLDRQIDYWMTAIRMSAWPTILHQQVRLGRAILEFWLPKKPEQK
jgi:hypothetical protein